MKLKRLLKNKYLFENGLSIGINNEIVNEYNLKKREELSHEEYLRVLELAALSTSYYYLAKRDYSKKEIYNKLIQKYWEKLPIKNVIEKLVENGYINDKEFALSYIQSRKGGRKKLEYELRLKGISQEDIEEVLFNYRPEDEYEELLKAWNRLGTKEDDKKIASLMRKGYSYSDIRKIVEREGGKK